MKKAQKQSYLFLAVAVLIALAVWFFRTKHSVNETPAAAQANNAKQAASVPLSKTQTAPGVWLGTLKPSNKPSSGNYMLITTDREIYIKTSRDFSSLLGKQVYVTYQGDVSSFVLGDILENVPQGN
jgi:hypothetical protein